MEEEKKRKKKRKSKGKAMVKERKKRSLLPPYLFPQWDGGEASFEDGE